MLAEFVSDIYPPSSGTSEFTPRGVKSSSAAAAVPHRAAQGRFEGGKEGGAEGGAVGGEGGGRFLRARQGFPTVSGSSQSR